jgi:hypothetical protein
MPPRLSSRRGAPELKPGCADATGRGGWNDGDPPPRWRGAPGTIGRGRWLSGNEGTVGIAAAGGGDVR